MQALDDASLEIRDGERLAVVGENGAGKTSLMNVLYGLYQPDRGEVRIGGEAVRLKSPKEALARGIGMVHQHFMLVPSLTVAENVVLGKEPARHGLFDLRAANEHVLATCRRFGFALDPEAPVESLSVGSQQKVEIVKALHRGARTLILDEPTAVLTPQEADELFAVARQLTAAGHTVIFISHKLKEVLAIATRIAVMRRGAVVADVAPGATSVKELAELMVRASPTPLSPSRVEREPPPGAQLPFSPSGAGGEPPPATRPPFSPSGVEGPSTSLRHARGERSSGSDQVEPRTPVLEVTDLTARGSRGRPALQGVSLTVAAGEIVGLAGVDGNGQRELAEVLTGLRPYDAGTFSLGGTVLCNPSPAALRQLGLAHVPEDRLKRAVVGPMSVEENVTLGRQHLPPFARGARIDFAGRRERAARLIADYDVRPPDPTARMVELSGGNQQKVVVARELDATPRLLVAVQPTRGLDVQAVAQVHARLRAERNRGCAVLVVSLDLDELLAVCDRLYVFFEGRVAGEIARARFDERFIGRLMLGARAETDTRD